MDEHKKVLLVTNSTSDEEIQQIKQALEQAKQHGIPLQLSLVHVIPNLPTCYFNIPSMVLVAEQYYEEARKCLNSIGNLLGIETKDQWLTTGRIKNEVIRLANKLSVDFILANSEHVQDIHKSFFFKHAAHYSLKQINNLGSFKTL